MHAAILGVAMSLVGVKVGWSVGPDRALVYTIQLDADDLARFPADGLIESDIPPQVKDVRRVRIEHSAIYSRLPVQQLPPDAPPDTPPPGAKSAVSSATSDTSKRQAKRFSAPQGQSPGGDDARPRDWLLGAGEKKEPRAKTGPQPAVSEPEAKAGDREAEAAPEPELQPTPPTSRWLLPLGVALCASLGGNVYFFWMWTEARARCRRISRGSKSPMVDEK